MSLAAMPGRVFAEIGDIDVLINNAGNDDRHKPGRCHAGLLGRADQRQPAPPAILHPVRRAGHGAQGRGRIINIGSISWHLGLEDLVLYETAKAGIEGMTRALARELGPDDIRVTCVVPGNVKTKRQEKWYTPEGEAEIVKAQCLKGRLVPENVASLVLFLASDDARLITGHEYFVDAGWR
jgi:D-xylose 1-dehydrogenase